MSLAGTSGGRKVVKFTYNIVGFGIFVGFVDSQDNTEERLPLHVIGKIKLRLHPKGSFSPLFVFPPRPKDPSRFGRLVCFYSSFLADCPF